MLEGVVGRCVSIAIGHVGLFQNGVNDIWLTDVQMTFGFVSNFLVEKSRRSALSLKVVLGKKL